MEVVGSRGAECRRSDVQHPRLLLLHRLLQHVDLTRQQVDGGRHRELRDTGTQGGFNSQPRAASSVPPAHANLTPSTALGPLRSEPAEGTRTLRNDSEEPKRNRCVAVLRFPHGESDVPVFQLEAESGRVQVTVLAAVVRYRHEAPEIHFLHVALVVAGGQLAPLPRGQLHHHDGHDT
ncbi:hypothetical protein EYF80_023018 [Liparis tanakae]|uniref:Uncharacterized protein n=1 Tax=Liparis tanakae TaxID=230148 RepID=A0A4Z2HLR1_9TELE|nr:hypothetical protein EYF80_023018 [Liparis tanakae]